MNIIILGASGFIGTNLVIALAKENKNKITVVDRGQKIFKTFELMNLSNLNIIQSDLTLNSDFESIVKNQDVVYHLISTTVPTTSNRYIADELQDNIIISTKLFEACVHQGVRKVIFFSSGGTVYGKESKCPLSEDLPTNPISSYGVQKLSIEKILYLYNYMYGLDYRIIRLSNPYGPYQRPNGVLGAVTTFTYKALRNEKIQVYGDGEVIRDFIYIDDAVRGIQKIAEGEDKHRTFNLGCGYGTSIRHVLKTIEDALNIKLNISYTAARKVDVPVNYLDINRYETAYGPLNPLSLKQGIMKTADFMLTYYSI